MKELTVIAPVHNEAEVLNSFYFALREVLTRLASKYKTKILFVLDGCTDQSAEIVRHIARVDPEVQALVLSTRFGHQMALLAGLDHVSADAVIMMDSDLQHPPSLLPKLLEEYEKGADIVNTLRRDNGSIPMFKRWTALWFYRLLNSVSTVAILPGSSDFRLLNRRVVSIFQKEIRERNQFLRGLVNWVGFRQVSIPFDVGVRSGGKTKYSLLRMAAFAVDGMVSFSKRPLLAAGLLGFGLAGFGFIYALYVTALYFLHIPIERGWATLIVFITVLSGTQLIFMGIVGAYIGAIFDEVKRRPHYLIDDKINIE